MSSSTLDSTMTGKNNNISMPATIERIAVLPLLSLATVATVFATATDALIFFFHLQKNKAASTG